MKHTLRPVARSLTTAILLVLGATTAAADSGPAGSNAAAGSAVVRGPAEHSKQATAAKNRTGSAADYWTAARMRAALPADDQPGLAAAAARHRSQLHADRVAAGQQQGQHIAAQKAAPQPSRFPPAAPSRSSGSSLNSEPSSLALPAGHPTARTNGKVFFTNAVNGLNYVCSAAVVNSEGRDTVWTAGHCVHGGAGQNWHLNWTFVPAYNYGLAPYGSWTAAQLWTTGGWFSGSEFKNDVGVAVMNPLNGEHIVDVLGGQGIAFHYSKNFATTAMGYPAASPYTGQELIQCANNAAPEWSFLWFSAETLRLGCNLTGGSSGGPWLRWFDGQWGWINGVTSYKYNNDVFSIYSPYFDGPESSLFDAVRNL